MSCHSSPLSCTHFSVIGPEFHKLQAHIPSSDILCLLLCCWKVPRALHSNSLTASISSLHPPPPQRKTSSSMFPHISPCPSLSYSFSLFINVSLLDTHSSVIQPNYTQNSSVYLDVPELTHDSWFWGNFSAPALASHCLNCRVMSLCDNVIFKYTSLTLKMMNTTLLNMSLFVSLTPSLTSVTSAICLSTVLHHSLPYFLKLCIPSLFPSLLPLSSVAGSQCERLWLCQAAPWPAE